MLKIEMIDLFYGYVRNYVTFGIRSGVKRSTRTHEVLGYYARLGKMLGCYVEYELDRFDLLWFWDLEDRVDRNPWLHIEHENSKARLSNLLDKITTSRSDNVIAVGYPDTMKDWRRFLAKMEKTKERLEGRVEVLLILDGRYTKEKQDFVVGYIFRKDKKTRTFQAMRKTMEDGIQYLENVT